MSFTVQGVCISVVPFAIQCAKERCNFVYPYFTVPKLSNELFSKQKGAGRVGVGDKEGGSGKRLVRSKEQPVH